MPTRRSIWIGLVLAAGCSSPAPDMPPDMSPDLMPAVPTPSYTWKYDPLRNFMLGVHGTGPSDVWAVGDNGGASYGHFDGATWTSGRANPGSTDRLLGVFATGPSDVWFVGRGSCTGSNQCGIVWHFDGTTFTPVLRRPKRFFRSVWASGPNDVWVVGSTDGTDETDSVRGGVSERWDGHGFTEMPSGGKELVLAVHGTASDDVWLVASEALDRGATGPSRQILHWTGTNLTTVLPPRPDTFYAVFARTREDVWIGGTDVYRRRGATWEVQKNPQGGFFSALSVVSETEAWGVLGGRFLYLPEFGSGPPVRFTGGSWRLLPEAPQDLQSWTVYGISPDEAWFGAYALVHAVRSP